MRARFLILLAIVLAGCSSRHNASTATPTTMRIAPSIGSGCSGCTSPPTTRHTSVRAPALHGNCTSPMLALSLVRQVSEMNQPAAFFGLTNRSPKNCTVAGYPDLRLYGPDGREVAIRPRPGGAYLLNDPGPHTLTLGPGETVYFGFGWYSLNRPNGDVRGCTYADRERALIPGSDVSIATRAKLSSPICGRTSSVTAIALRRAFKIAAP